MSSDDYIKTILAALQKFLRTRGFKKKESTFWRESKGIRHLIGLQRSQSSTASSVRVTLNLAVICPAILSSWDPQYSVWSGHWKERIGSFEPTPSDKWWVVDSAASAESAVAEILAILETRALPELDRIDSPERLAETLQAGASRSVGEIERERTLQRLAALPPD
jgi:hypothetical protein